MNSYHITSDNIDEYIKQDKQENHRISSWGMLQSQIHINGLKSAYDDLLKNAKDFDKFKQDHRSPLLKDLEKLSKRADFGRDAPKFNPEFYNELTKDPSDRSEDYKKFITYCSNLSAGKFLTEKLSAQLLVDLDTDQDLNLVKTNLEKNIAEFKNTLHTQTDIDLQTRANIFLKDSTGKVSKWSYEELEKTNLLNDAQKDFIKTSWNQGTFEGGWILSSHPSIEDKNKQKSLLSAQGRASLIIDTTGDTVKLINFANCTATSMDTTSPKKEPFIQGAMTVDIGNLNGTQFVPGCMDKMNITFDITEKTSKLEFSIPKELNTVKSTMSHEKTNSLSNSIDEYYISMLDSKDTIEKSLKNIELTKGERSFAFIIETLGKQTIQQINPRDHPLIALDESLQESLIAEAGHAKFTDKIKGQLNKPDVLNFIKDQLGSGTWKYLENILGKDKVWGLLTLEAKDQVLDLLEVSKGQKALPYLEKLLGKEQLSTILFEQSKIPTEKIIDFLQTQKGNDTWKYLENELTHQRLGNVASVTEFLEQKLDATKLGSTVLKLNASTEIIDDYRKSIEEKKIDLIPNASKETLEQLVTNDKDKLKISIDESIKNNLKENNTKYKLGVEFEAALAMEYKIQAVEKFNKLEGVAKDIKETYAEQILADYLQNREPLLQNKKIGDKQVDTMKHDIVRIMSPVLDEKGKGNLEKGADKIVRHFASENGMKLSVTQKIKLIKDKITEAIPGHKQDKVQEIIKNNPALFQKLESFTAKPTNVGTSTPVVQKQKEKDQRTR